MSRLAAKLIGEQLRQAREAQRLSVAEAAMRLKVRRQTLYNYEKGRWLPKMSVLVAAAAAWNWPFEISGCKVLPEAGAQRRPTPQPIQGVLPLRFPREYKGARVRIQQRGQEMIITAILRTRE